MATKTTKITKKAVQKEAIAPVAQPTALRRTFSGVVLNKSGAKTIRVEVVEKKMHPKYRKQYKVSTRFLVHDENNTAEVGKTVTFVECRPLSASKRWRLVEKSNA